MFPHMLYDMMLRHDIPQPNEVLLRESFRLEYSTQRVPFISDPRVEFEGTCSEDLVAICPVIVLCQYLTCLIDSGIIARTRRVIPMHVARPHKYSTRRNRSKLMDPPNADILELKEKMGELINGSASSSGSKKPFGNGQRKKEGDTSVVYAQREHGRDCYYQHTAAVTIPAGDQSVQQQQQSPQQRTQRAGYQLRTLAPLRPDQRPVSYDESVKCEFHSGALGHNVEGCKAFKHAVQDLVDSKAINFTLLPNVNANPMPTHGPMGVNAISEDPDHICAVGEETDSDCEFESWIKSCVLGMEIQNWKAEKIITVTLREE
ncbi:hypothetical protein KIW84_011604 [Lathyrus oleraceus]|uniref:Uncharacterized protein n=1 Tax=Pisum sativum TaxID=3888 RepID=A0A9D5BFD1_PEA|nr:hypothetical protein KIW84_011604 [Pisum sativum]